MEEIEIELTEEESKKVEEYAEENDLTFQEAFKEVFWLGKEKLDIESYFYDANQTQVLAATHIAQSDEYDIDDFHEALLEIKNNE
ncbi:hypothetical protein [Natronorubrum sulfidifaciens]|nr:hypothetical protein [Natronorubrum sulfidifaciens]